MAIKYEKIQEGQVLWNVRSHKMGNTTMKTVSVYAVKIIKLIPEHRAAVVSWNGNREQEWCENQLRKLYANKPETITDMCGAARIKRRERKAK